MLIHRSHTTKDPGGDATAGYEDEWNSFKTVLEAHADKEERDLIPAPPEVKITDAELEELGNKMATKIEEYRGSAMHRLCTKGGPRWYALCSRVSGGWGATTRLRVSRPSEGSVTAHERRARRVPG